MPRYQCYDMADSTPARTSGAVAYTMECDSATEAAMLYALLVDVPDPIEITVIYLDPPEEE